MVELQKAKSNLEAQGVTVLAASVQDIPISQQMAQRLGVDIPILSDKGTQAARAFGIYDLPGSMGPFSTHSFWLIDRNGTIRWHEVSLQMHVDFSHVEGAVSQLRAAG